MRIKEWILVEDLSPGPVTRGSPRRGEEQDSPPSLLGKGAGGLGRPGFTLVELLVVITIIVILLALTAGATMRFLGVQQESNSQYVVRKVVQVLDRQWKIVIDQASKEPLPPPPGSPNSAGYNFIVNQMAGGDPALARVIWVKMRLRQEFPMSFDEVLPYISNNTPPILPPLPEYVMALAPLIATGSPPPPPYPPSIFQWYTWDQQNSAMLLLALSRSRGGVSLNLDDLGSDTTADLIPPQPMNAPQQLPLGLLPNVRIIVDAWKQPVVFFRWASSNNELDGLNPAPLTSAEFIFRDPQDPKGLLLNPAWWTSRLNAPSGPGFFEAYCHPLFTIQAVAPPDGRPYLPPHQPGTTPPPYPAGQGPYPGTPYPYFVWGYEYYMTPVVASAGKNKRFGVVQPPYLSPVPWGQLQIGQLAAWYGMLPDGTGDDNDNIYSYRLR